MKNGTVKNVYYLTPVSGTNNKRRRIRCKSNLVQLRQFSNNFSFSLKILGLSDEMEVIREAKSEGSFTYMTPAIYHYWKVLGGEEERKKLRSRRGECCLCNQVITYDCFKEHMVITHLPEESCDICGREIPAREFREHWEYCDTGDIGSDIGNIVTQEILVEIWGIL